MKRILIILITFLLMACTTPVDRIWQRTENAAMTDEHHQQKELDESDKSIYRVGVVTYIILFSIIATAMYVSLMFLHQRTKKQAQNDRFRFKKARLERLLEAQQEELEERRENSRQNADLQHEMAQLKGQIKSYQAKLSNEIAEREGQFYDSDIYKYFASFKDDNFQHEAPTKENWQEMIFSFRKAFPNYYKFIAEETRLTPDQLKVCILVRLFFPVYAMQRILDADSNRITRIKRQANRRLFDEDTAITLENNLKAHHDERM